MRLVPSVAGFSFCLLLAAWPCSIAAQSPPAGSSVIAQIHATGSRRYTDAQIAATSGLKPGDAVTREQLQQAADRLARLGVFSGVNYRFTSLGDQIVLNFELQDAALVPVMFDNFPWFSDEELTAAIRQAVPLFDGSAPADGMVLDEMSAALSSLLATRNVPAPVEHRLVADPWSDGMMVEFRQTGAPLKTGSLAFGDSLAQNSEKLRDRVADLAGKPFSRFALEVFENEQVRPIYLSSGHLRVKFGAPVLRFAGSPGGPPSSEIQVTVPIDPGPGFSIAGISWTGHNALNQTLLSDAVVTRAGDPADGMRLASDWQRVEAEYAHRGYLDVKIDPQPQFDDVNAKVDYRVTIAEGTMYRMGDLIITGLSVDAERVLRKVWTLAPGLVFDKTYYDEMLRKLERPSTLIFGDRPIHYTQMGHWLRTDPEKHAVDVLLDFQ
jgi:outer membrane protein assembly factor BamA